MNKSDYYSHRIQSIAAYNPDRYSDYLRLQQLFLLPASDFHEGLEYVQLD